MKKILLIAIMLFSGVISVTSWGLNDEEREFVGNSEDILGVTENSQVQNLLDTSVIQKNKKYEKKVTVIGTLRVIAGKYVLENVEKPSNSIMEMHVRTNRYNLAGNLLGIKSFVNKRIAVRGNEISRVGNELLVVSDLKSFYYFEKPEIENMMAEFVKGTLKTVSGEEKYYYVDTEDGKKVFLAQHEGKVENIDQYVNRIVTFWGKSRIGNAPYVLKGAKIFETSSIQKPENPVEIKRVEVRGKLEKSDGKFYLVVASNNSGQSQTAVNDRILLTNNLSYMDKYVGRYIKVTGMQTVENQTKKDIKVYFYEESPEIENDIANIGNGILKSIKGEEIYYYIQSGNTKTFITGNLKNPKLFLGKKVQVTGKIRYGSAPLVLKGNKVFDVGNMSSYVGTPITDPIQEPIQNPIQNPLPEPITVPGNNNFWNNWFFQFYSSFFGMMMLSFVNFFKF